MPLTLKSQRTDSIPLDVRAVTHGRLRGLSLTETRAFPVRLGRHTVELGDIFEVSGSLEEDDTIEWRGDLHAVHHIGSAMSDGATTIVHGDTGRHLGHGMTGGLLTVHGNVSDFAGSTQAGGQIRIHGDAADWAGGAYSDQIHGMRGGELIIHGSAGQNAGSRMRRGLLIVCGDCGAHLAEHMLAGTIVLGGNASDTVGQGMQRGTLILLHTQPTPLTVNKACNADLTILRLIERRLSLLQTSLTMPPANEWALYQGDQTGAGKGELFMPVAFHPQ